MKYRGTLKPLTDKTLTVDLYREFQAKLNSAQYDVEKALELLESLEKKGVECAVNGWVGQMEKSLRSLLGMMEKELPPLGKELQLMQKGLASVEINDESTLKSMRMTGLDFLLPATYVHTYTYALLANLIRAEHRGGIEPKWEHSSYPQAGAVNWKELLRFLEPRPKGALDWKKLVKYLGANDRSRMMTPIADEETRCDRCMTEAEELQQEFKPACITKLEKYLGEIITLNTEALKERNTNIKKFEEGPGLDLQPESAQGLAETASTLKR